MSRKERAELQVKQETVGTVTVDSGTLWIGDPINADTAMEHIQDVAEGKIDENANMVNGKRHWETGKDGYGGIGLHTGLGDGVYPVHITTIDGVIASVTIDFFPKS